MTPMDFYQRLEDELIDFLPGNNIKSVKYEEVLKDNGVKRPALRIVSNDINITPTIYLDSFYEEYEMGRSFNSIIREVAVTYTNHKANIGFDLEKITSFDIVKDNILYRLVNYEKNKEFLQNAPHRKIEDLALTYVINVVDQEALHYDSDSNYIIRITNNIFEGYGVSEEQLYDVASRNMKVLDPPTLKDLSEVLFGSLGKDVMQMLEVGEEEARQLIDNAYKTEMKMYVLSSKSTAYGSGHILDPNVMDNIKKLYGKQYFVIPSSVHECIIVPFNGDYSQYKMYEEMVRDVNRTQLRESEILSNGMYFVDADRHLFLQADKAQEVIEKLELEEKLEQVKKPAEKPIRKPEIRQPKL